MNRSKRRFAKTLNSKMLLAIKALQNSPPGHTVIVALEAVPNANNAFLVAMDLIAATADLRDKFVFTPHLRKIVFEPSGATMLIVTKGSQALTGRSHASIVLDEEHLLTRTVH